MSTQTPGQLNAEYVRYISAQIEAYAVTVRYQLPSFDNPTTNLWNGSTEIISSGTEYEPQVGNPSTYVAKPGKAWLGTTKSLNVVNKPYLLGAWVRAWTKEDQVAMGLADQNAKLNSIAACSYCDSVYASAERLEKARGITLHFRQVEPSCPLEFYFSGGFGIDELDKPDMPNNFCGGALGCLSLQFFIGLPLADHNAGKYIAPLVVQNAH